MISVYSRFASYNCPGSLFGRQRPLWATVFNLLGSSWLFLGSPWPVIWDSWIPPGPSFQTLGLPLALVYALGPLGAFFWNPWAPPGPSFGTLGLSLAPHLGPLGSPKARLQITSLAWRTVTNFNKNLWKSIKKL